MKIRVRYFASVREAVGQGSEELQTQAANLAALREGSEVAFFPPVTGG
jgi:molybdopterin synthase sulfur carrier subunit